MGILLFGVIQLIAQSPPSIVNPRSYREKDILTQISNKENSNTTFSLSFDGVNWKDYSVVRNRPLWFDLRNGQNQGAYLRVCTSRAQDCETHRIHGNNTYQIFWNKSAYNGIWHKSANKSDSILRSILMHAILDTVAQQAVMAFI